MVRKGSPVRVRKRASSDLPPDTPLDDLEPTAVLTAEVAGRIRVYARSVRRAVARGDLTACRACGLRILAYDAAEWWRKRSRTST